MQIYGSLVNCFFLCFQHAWMSSHIVDVFNLWRSRSIAEGENFMILPKTVTWGKFCGSGKLGVPKVFSKYTYCVLYPKKRRLNNNYLVFIVTKQKTYVFQKNICFFQIPPFWEVSRVWIMCLHVPVLFPTVSRWIRPEHLVFGSTTQLTLNDLDEYISLGKLPL